MNRHDEIAALAVAQAAIDSLPGDALLTHPSAAGRPPTGSLPLSLPAPHPVQPDLRDALDRVESLHRQGDYTEDGFVGNSIDGKECARDGEDWPCSAQRLRHAIERQRKERGNA